MKIHRTINRSVRLIALTVAVALAGSGATAFGQIVVKGDWVSLADVVPVSGDAARILLTPAPPPGQTLALDPAFIVSVARGAGVDVSLAPDKPIMVTRAALAAPVKVSAPVAVQPAVQPATRAPAPKQDPGARPSASHILVLARDLTRGDRLTRADLEWVVPPSPRTLRNAPDTIAEIVGLEAKRTLKAGAPANLSDLQPPTVVRKGEAVKIVYATGGLRLTVDGLAQSDAAAGEPVRVLNSYSRRTIDAVAHASGEAHVLTN